MPPGEHTIVITAAGEHALSPGDDPVTSKGPAAAAAAPPIQAVTVPIRVVALPFQEQKKYVKVLRGGFDSDDDDAESQASEQVDISIPIPQQE
jgi:hypothetical protein